MVVTGPREWDYLDRLLGCEPSDKFLLVGRSGSVQVELPQPGAEVSVFLANTGGNPISIDFLNNNGVQCTEQVLPNIGVEERKCAAPDLRFVVIVVCSAELHLCRVCYEEVVAGS